MSNKEVKNMFNDFTKKTKRNKIIIWTTAPIAFTSILGGAIYFAVVNNRPITKPLLEVENFNKIADNVKIETNSVLSFDIDDLLENYQSKKDVKDFDFDAYLANFFQKKLAFDDNKKVNVRFLSIEKSEQKKHVKLTYEVVLNYETTNGIFEPKKNRGTEKSKYYKKYEVNIPYNTTIENLSNNLLFKQNVEKKIDKIREIIYKNKDDPEKNKKWLNSGEFRLEVWEWFEKICNESNIYPDLYDKENYSLKPYMGNPANKDYKFVEWNPYKGLDSLTIDYQFVNKKDSNIKSSPSRKIFTIK